MRTYTRSMRLLTAQPVGREEAFAPRQRSAPLCSFVVATVVLYAGVVSRAASTDPALAHEEPPTQPWIKTPSSAVAGGVAHCGPWERDGHRSIQVNVDRRGCNVVGDAANEPSIAVDPSDPRKIVIGWRQFDSVASDFRQAGYAYSHDGGHTWVFPGSLQPGVFHSDPVLACDADGNLYYHTITWDTRGFVGDLFRSRTGGVSWSGPIHGLDGDKPWMAIDRTNGVGRNNIYICSGGGFARSTDSGETFVDSHDGGGSCKGGTVAVAPTGDVFVAIGSGTLQLSSSPTAYDPSLPPVFSFETQLSLGFYGRDSGAPNIAGLLGQAWVATHLSPTPNTSNVYVLALASIDPVNRDPSDVVFAASTDSGITWSRPTFINDDSLSPNSWQWFNTLSVAPNGRIDVVWNDTRNSQQPNLSELFYSFSADGGRTWSPNVPVSPMFDSWVGAPYANPKLGDYYHMVSDNLGVNVAYAATFNGEQDVYFLRIGPWDCNGNEIDDDADIAGESSLDCNVNKVPDECEYRADLDGYGFTTLTYYAALASLMTGPGQATISGCDALLDIDHDGDIDLADFYGFQRVFAGP